MLQTGKLNNVMAEMKRIKIDILGINDVQWSEPGQKKTLWLQTPFLNFESVDYKSEWHQIIQMHK